MPATKPLCVALLLTALQLSVVAASTDKFQSISSDAADLEPWLLSTRRGLHQIPELGFQEFETSKRIQSILTELGIPFE